MNAITIITAKHMYAIYVCMQYASSGDGDGFDKLGAQSVLVEESTGQQNTANMRSDLTYTYCYYGNIIMRGGVSLLHHAVLIA